MPRSPLRARVLGGNTGNTRHTYPHAPQVYAHGVHKFGSVRKGAKKKVAIVFVMRKADFDFDGRPLRRGSEL